MTYQYTMTKSGFLLTSHWAAPMYSTNDPSTLFDQVMTEMTSLQSSEEVRNVIRQTALVSLWFFLKYVAGYDGPYHFLNRQTDLDIANFRQGPACMEPGTHSALFAPRKYRKSTIATHGADTWEITRDPDISIMLSHAIRDQADGFFRLVKNTIDSNEFYKWLFGREDDPMGSFVPPDDRYARDRWNDKEIVVPNRNRRQDAATLECLSVGGTAQGKHPMVMDCDDLIGESDLNAERGSSADMWRAGNWFKLNKRALPANSDSRVMLKATRYAVDDIYEDVFKNARAWYGDWPKDTPEEYHPKDEGEFNIFYQPLRDHQGRITLPETYNERELAAMVKDDYWTVATQIENKPWASGLAELSTYGIPLCELDRIDGNWVIIHGFDDDREVIDLADLDVIQTADPAGSEKYSSTHTSRQAQCVIAQDWNRNFYVLSLHADYCPITRLFDWLFDDKKKFDGYIRATYPEMQGGFKILGPILRQEEATRHVILNMIETHKVADKDSFIREHMVPVLEEGRLHIVEVYNHILLDELGGFPQSRKRDVLDVVSLAISKSLTPVSPKDRIEYARRRELSRVLDVGRSENVTGY